MSAPITDDAAKGRPPRDPEVVPIAVVGAGAAGLWAAREAAAAGARVVLLEKTARTGSKVLASGGTRCNLTTTLEPDAAAALFGKEGERFLASAFWNLPPLEVRRRFETWGVPTREAPLEKVFPASDRARDVRDALEREALAAGVELRLGAPVVAVEAEGSLWRVRFAEGEVLRVAKLLLCPGGQSYPKTGTTGDGYRWLRELGLPVVEPVPALVPLVSPEAWPGALAGIAPQDVDVRLVSSKGRTLRRRSRPVVFSHRGLSGPGAMDVSEPVARAAARGEREPSWVHLDLVPGWDRAELREALVAAASEKGAPRLSRILPVELPKRLLERVALQAGSDEPNPRCQGLSKAQRHEWVEALKELRIPVNDTEGYDKAEVTAGGLALKAVQPDTLEVRGRRGLYVFGELLDLQGPIGGLNFQAAFATAELAAADAVRALHGG
jgi:predicted Rossmann fold flavoprotein